MNENLFFNMMKQLEEQDRRELEKQQMLYDLKQYLDGELKKISDEQQQTELDYYINYRLPKQGLPRTLASALKNSIEYEINKEYKKWGL